MPLIRPLISTALMACLLASCATANPATGAKNFTLMNERQELAVGQQTAEKIIKEIGQYTEKPALVEYIKGIATRMWATTERSGVPLQLVVLDSEQFNAWAVPGYINFYRGILPYFNSETQLAEVMGHEMAHITARHTARSNTRQTVTGLALLAGSIALAATTNNDGLVNTVAQLGSAGAGLGLLAYGRGDELEADRLGLRYMGLAGYDAREAYNSNAGMLLYEAYAKQQASIVSGGQATNGGLLGNLTSTHPQTPDRLAQVEKLVGRPDGTLQLPQGIKPATTQDDPFGQKRYFSMIDGISYGPKKVYGIAGRNVVYFPGQQFVWRLPNSSAGGFEIALTSVRSEKEFVWKAVNPQGGVQANIAFTPLAGTPVQTMMKRFTDMSPDEKWQQVSIGQGSGTVTAWTSGSVATDNRSVFVRVVGVPVANNMLAVIRYNIPAAQPKADEAVLTALRSGAVLSADRAKMLEPLRVRIKTSAGEGVASMASQLPTGSLNEMWFRALNGLQPGESIASGRQYKTVVDPNVQKGF